MLSAAQKDGNFAGTSVVLQAFTYLTERNSHFHQAETYFLLVVSPNAVVLKIIIAPSLNACSCHHMLNFGINH